jgi:hypothetical protein
MEKEEEKKQITNELARIRAEIESLENSFKVLQLKYFKIEKIENT